MNEYDEVNDILETKFNYNLFAPMVLPFSVLNKDRVLAFNTIFLNNNIPLYIQDNTIMTDEINNFSLDMKSRAIMKEILFELFGSYLSIEPIHWGDDYKIESNYKIYEKFSDEEIKLCEKIMACTLDEETTHDNFQILTFMFNDTCHYLHIKKALKNYYVSVQGGLIACETFGNKTVSIKEDESLESFLIRLRKEALGYYKKNNEDMYECIRCNDMIIENLTNS